MSIFVLLIITIHNEVAKVMFLQASVCPQGGRGVCLSACWDTTPPREQTPPPRAETPPEQTNPPEQTPPGTDTPPEQTPPEADKLPPQIRHPSGSRLPLEQTPPWSRQPPDTATAADGMHPTGMHSCLRCIYQ